LGWLRPLIEQLYGEQHTVKVWADG